MNQKKTEETTECLAQQLGIKKNKKKGKSERKEHILWTIQHSTTQVIYHDI